MTETDEDRIRQRAYEISEREGHPPGRELEFWHAARLELASEGQIELAADTPPEGPAMRPA
jgi:hypothetical protein